MKKNKNKPAYKELEKKIQEPDEENLNLKTSEEQYKSLFNNIGIATCIFNNSKIITICNTKFEELSGYSKNEIQGKMMCTDFVKGDDLERMEIYHTERSSQTGNPPSEYDFSFIDKYGKIKNIHINITFIPNTKERICSLIDITERKKEEEALKKAKEKAEESDRLKIAFLANMSHEIRTPMNAILGFAQLLNIKQHSAEKIKEYTDIIKNKGHILIKLIDDIIEVSKFEAGKLSISKSECNLDELLHELYGFYNEEKIYKGKENLEIRLKKPEKDDLKTVYTDPGRLQQVLSNLINNALKFTDKGLIEFGYYQKSKNTLEFYVKDTGIGLAREQQKFIFDRFRQVEETTTRQYNVSGLGLTISKGIVKLLGGKIRVKSEPDQGATFFFTIPFEKTAKKVKPADVEYETYRNYNWQDKVILVAEDEEVNYQFLEAVLEKTQAKLLHAKNGKQAVDLCKSINKIDLVLMDIKMPEMDGYEAASQIKQFRKKIPIIAQTAFSMEDAEKKCKKAGCVDYIPKPIEIATLFSKINKYFTAL